MIVAFFFDKEATMPRAASRLSRVVVTGPLAPFVQAYRRELRRRGYTPRSAVNQLYRRIAADARRVGARAGHKAALKLLGHDVGLPRRPGLPTTEAHVERIRKVWQEEGLI